MQNGPISTRAPRFSEDPTNMISVETTPNRSFKSDHKQRSGGRRCAAKFDNDRVCHTVDLFIRKRIGHVGSTGLFHHGFQHV